MKNEKVTIPQIQKMKAAGDKITMLTAYDYPTASLVDKAGTEIILVGDSVGNVVLGLESTVPVTMDDMLHHAKAARKGVKRALLVADMPFMSYNITTEEAVYNAGRFLKEAGCDAVKLEGGSDVAPTIAAIVKAGIPVLGHLGLTPQTVSKLGGYRVQGKSAKDAGDMLDSARELQRAGCFAIVLECVPDKLAGIMAKKIKIPVIGIGAGPACDGQVLVLHDMLGLNTDFVPKFVKQYARLHTNISSALDSYIKDVKSGKFPDESHSFTADKKIYKNLK